MKTIYSTRDRLGALSKSQFGPFSIDTEERILRRDAELVALTPKAFDLLTALVEHAGRLLSKEDLLQKVWPDTFVEESNLAYHVFALRRALGDTADDAQYIETVPKRGYRFVAVVTPVAAEVPAPRSPDRLVAPRRKLPPRAIWAGSGLVVMLVYVSVQSWRAAQTPETPRALPLTSLSGAVRTPSLSPDGTHVAFTWTGVRQDNQDVYVQVVGAGAPMRLTTDAGSDYGPSWSPDGRTIAFLRRRDGRVSDVRLIAASGGQDRVIATIEPRLAPYRPLSVSWCADSACVLVTDAPDGGDADAIFAISVATGAKLQLTHPGGRAMDVDPIMSPDGRTLVFRRDTTPFSGSFHRLALNTPLAPTGAETRLTPALGAGRPAWMPNGREILFSDRGILWRLDVVSGGEPSRLPFVGEDGHAPVVGPDAQGRLQLVYVRSFSDANVWRVDSAGDGTAAPRPPSTAIASTRFDGTPNVSPNGAGVAFTSDRSGDLEIWAARLDGSSTVQLTATGTGPGFPRWSPDGARIAFHGALDGRPGVMFVAAAGGPVTTLTTDASDSGYPSFSRDGGWIYFCSVRSGAAHIWKVAVTGGTAVQVTRTAGTLGIEAVDGRDLYYVEASERSSPLWRQPLAGGSPVKVLDDVILGSFDVVARGIYYLDRLAEDTRLRYFDFSGGRSTTVASGLGSVRSGLSATADGRTVFFSRVDLSVDELMVVRNFK